jgi:acetyl-CoA synthetase
VPGEPAIAKEKNMSFREEAVEQIERWLLRYGGEDVDVADLLCDSHAGERSALLFEDGNGPVRDVKYGALAEQSRRLAGSLAEVGVTQGSRVAVMMRKSPQLLISLLAIWRCGAVHVPLFTAFGPEAVHYRLRQSRAQALIVDAASREQIDPGELGELAVFCLGATAGDRDLEEAIANGKPARSRTVNGRDLLVLLFTSGTTGNPKGVKVPVRALASFRSYMEHGLALSADDIYWNLADPGWAYGLYYGVVGPLLLGQRLLWRASKFDAADTFEAIVRYGVTNLAAAPTVYRSLQAAAVPNDFRSHHKLRALSSAGEPLDGALINWSRRELGLTIHDHYGQSELGMAAYFSHHPALATEPQAGSMGRSAPGYRVVVLDENGDERLDVDGELAIDVSVSPQYWFFGYDGDPERTAENFRLGAGYFLTGDSARQEGDGLLFFSSRADDVISTSGYRVGPFEVESALLEHSAVREAAVIGTPDALRGEAVTAIVVPTPGREPDVELAIELQGYVKTRLAKHLYPRRITFVAELPKTPSGKVQRRVLRDHWHDHDDILAVAGDAASRGPVAPASVKACVERGGGSASRERPSPNSLAAHGRFPSEPRDDLPARCPG